MTNEPKEERNFAESVVESHPGTAVLTAFGIGVTLGLVVTTLLAPKSNDRWGTAGFMDMMHRLQKSMANVPKTAGDYLSHVVHRD